MKLTALEYLAWTVLAAGLIWVIADVVLNGFAP